MRPRNAKQAVIGMKIRSDLAQATVKLSKALPAGLLLFLLPGQIPLFGQANVETIIQRSIEALKRDWATDPQFDYTERDQEKGGSKINEVTMLFGSPYQRLITVNGRPLSASEKAEEQKKFEEAVKRTTQRNTRKAIRAHREVRGRTEARSYHDGTVDDGFRLSLAGEPQAQRPQSLRARSEAAERLSSSEPGQSGFDRNGGKAMD